MRKQSQTDLKVQLRWDRRDEGSGRGGDKWGVTAKIPKITAGKWPKEAAGDVGNPWWVQPLPPEDSLGKLRES